MENKFQIGDKVGIVDGSWVKRIEGSVRGYTYYLDDNETTEVEYIHINDYQNCTPSEENGAVYIVVSEPYYEEINDNIGVKVTYQKFINIQSLNTNNVYRVLYDYTIPQEELYESRKRHCAICDFIAQDFMAMSDVYYNDDDDDEY